jgi:hypothetical protein
MSENTTHILIVPHYSEVIFAFLNVIRALEKTPTKPLILVQENHTHLQQICAECSIPTEIVPAFSWRNQLKGPRACLAEPRRVRRFVDDLLARRRITGILLVDDRRYTELFLIQAARQRHIPTLVLMWAATNTADDMVRWRQKTTVGPSSHWSRQPAEFALTAGVSPRALSSNLNRVFSASPPAGSQHPRG